MKATLSLITFTSFHAERMAFAIQMTSDHEINQNNYNLHILICRMTLKRALQRMDLICFDLILSTFK